MINLPVVRHFLNPDADSENRDRVLLEVKTSRTGEETPEAMVQFLSSLTGLKKLIIPGLLKLGLPFSLELAVVDQMVHFFISVPSKYQAFVESQLIAQYPKALMAVQKDYLPELFAQKETLSVGQMKLTHGHLYPIRTYADFKDVDPMSSLLGMLSKSQPGDVVSIQFLLVPVGNGWQKRGRSSATGKYKDASGAEHANPYAKVITDKVAFDGYKTAIRLAVNATSKERSSQLLQQIANSFSSFNNPSGNGFLFRRTYLWQTERLIKAMSLRSKRFMPLSQILNVAEISTLYHFPGVKLATIHNISWHKVILSEPPEMLPIAEGKTPEEKGEINFFARTEYKNRMMTFGIKANDRRRHMYIIGKTGTGKSTLIANLAISDIRNRKGMCIVDPHGDLCETILDYIPSYRINDVINLDPSDLEYSFSMNPLEVTDDYQRELVVSGIVGIFHKIYGLSWGPRLEYILRNTLMSAAHLPNPTLLMVPEFLTNERFRRKALDTYIQDPVLRNFWLAEFANMNPRLQSEAISPILNKIGQFLSSRFIRNILQNPKSTIDLENIMNDGKILLCNLSQGKLGEDNAALMGAMIITKIQLAAMNRVSIPEAQRRDFYLYVDEFQNFATSSFIKILSEARKYRLNLIMANQYISQIPEDVRGAIFGNAGSMFSFLIGATDAVYMAKEFGERFKEDDLLALGNHQGILKLAIDGVTQSPFLAYTLPLPRSITQNREKVIKNSRMRYMKPVKKEEPRIKTQESKDTQQESVEASSSTEHALASEQAAVPDSKGANSPVQKLGQLKQKHLTNQSASFTKALAGKEEKKQVQAVREQTQEEKKSQS
jgi:hypothetical protein